MSLLGILAAAGGIGTAIAGLVAYAQRQRIARLEHETTAANKKVGELRREIDDRDRAIAERDRIIKEMGNASRKAREAHERIRSGTDRDRFDASLGELRDDT